MGFGDWLTSLFSSNAGDIKHEKIPILPESIDLDKSLIIVSDLHLGGSEDTNTSARFIRFLDYVSGLFQDSESRQVYDQESSTHKLLPPQKIILLGDIFELTDPRCQDRNNVLLDAMIPIVRLGQMDCDIVFITGNHDEDIGELVNVQKRIENNVRSDQSDKRMVTPGQETNRHLERNIKYIPPMSNKSRDAGLDFQIRTGRKFSVYQRSYIPGPKREGLDVGGIYYAFFHGQQFDAEIISHRISEFVKKRFDPLSVIEDYANTDLAKSISIWHSILFLGMWIIAAIIFFNWPGTESYAPVFGGFAFLIFALLILYQSYLHRDDTKGNNGLILFWGSLVIFAIIIAILATGMYFHYLGTLFSIAFWILTFIATVIVIPKIFAHVKRGIYNSMKVWKKPVNELEGKKNEQQRGHFKRHFTKRYFRDEMFNIDSNVVIFGHTHCAGKERHSIPADSERDLSSKDIYLINSGCWVKEKSAKEPDRRTGHSDTFVYVDAHGMRLMEWVEEQAGGNPCRGRARTIVELGPSELLAGRGKIVVGNGYRKGVYRNLLNPKFGDIGEELAHLRGEIFALKKPMEDMKNQFIAAAIAAVREVEKEVAAEKPDPIRIEESLMRIRGSLDSAGETSETGKPWVERYNNVCRILGKYHRIRGIS